MKIYINNTLRQSADTMGHITQHLELSGWVDTVEDEYHTTEAYLVTGDETSLVTDDVTSLVTDGVTSLVTDGVTLFNAEKECQTICVSRGCEYRLLEGVTLSVTPLVTLFVTNKEEKNKKRRISPCTPYRRKKQKKKKQHTQTRMHARKNSAYWLKPDSAPNTQTRMHARKNGMVHNFVDHKFGNLGIFAYLCLCFEKRRVRWKRKRMMQLLQERLMMV